MKSILVVLIVAISPWGNVAAQVSAPIAVDGAAQMDATAAPVLGFKAQLPDKCPRSDDEAKAMYVGPYKGEDSRLGPDDMALDIYCANAYRQSRYPNGYVTIYGSSKITESDLLMSRFALTSSYGVGYAAEVEAYKKTYDIVRDFARLWTKEHGSEFPIMTGAGPGLMEAGSRGAMEAGGPSIGYTTYYEPAPAGSLLPKTGNAAAAFAKYPEKGQNQIDIITEGLIFSSVSIRETSMILHSAAIVIAPGGTGTEWEIFQIIEMMKSDQLKDVPIYIIGDKERHWKSFEARLDDMICRKTFRSEQVYPLIEFIASPEELVSKLGERLKPGVVWKPGANKEVKCSM
ncbi:LOG family protein [Pseudoxanthomonas sp.]|jgi:Predicted Rossmann fold nucleotide-binding protein|uniref:LOG family protein n=1 Tax=Pseudoxanthomonas sp. TaxID=1871049 RepID=UPI002FE0E158